MLITRLKNAVAILLVYLPASIYAQVPERDVYDALRVEKQLGIRVLPSHELLLDSIFRVAGEEIIINRDFQDSDQVLTALRAFSDILTTRFGFRYALVESVFEAMEKRQLDCNYNSLLFYTWANRINGCRLFPIVVPGHMFVRWYMNDSTWLNYETTSGQFISDETYRNNFVVMPQPEARGLYLQPVSDEQLTAVHLAEVALDVSDTSLNFSIDLNRRALIFDSTSFHVLRNLSYMYYQKGLKDSSDLFFRKALALDSMNYSVYKSQGEMLLWSEEYREAIRWFDKAASINPADPDIFIYKTRACIRMKEVEMAMEAFQQATHCIEQKGIFAFLANYSLLSGLDNEILQLIGR
jgi:tetratricopeptide (TPR) repeat protein